MTDTPNTPENPNPIPDVLPVVATTNLVLFPFMLVPLSVGREASLKAIDAALQENRIVALTLQAEPGLETPTPEQMNEIGCAASIVRMQRTPDGAQVIVQGLERIRLSDFDASGDALRARVTPLPDAPESTPELEALMTSLLERFRRIVDLSPILPDEAFEAAQAQKEPGKLADFVATTLNIEPPQRQELLSELDVKARLERVNEFAQNEINVLEVTRQISDQTREELDKGQRDYILRQQLREIQKELGEGDSQEQEIEELRRLVDEAKMPVEVRKAADRELERLARIPTASPEYSVTRNYLDYLIAVPWSKSTDDNLDVTHAAQVLSDEHYGLQDAKDRILEYLAVRRLAPDSKGPILCLVGPPGVGKTSLAHSIANALGRKFVRMALGGVRDEAEIRGHRRTYIGALPGRIVQGLRDAGTNNPVMILDEIDKLGSDYRGDPTSALLEVLDPQQNSTFKDHYLEVPVDLSQVMFITTANVLDTIPGPLRDRMEIIRIPGYTEEEKRFIAERYLLPRQLKENGLSDEQIEITSQAIEATVGGYTREAGVRSLERELGRICRKVARKVAEEVGVVAIAHTETADEQLASLDEPEASVVSTPEADTVSETSTLVPSLVDEADKPASEGRPLSEEDKAHLNGHAPKAEEASTDNGLKDKALKQALAKVAKVTITPAELEDLLGPARFTPEMAGREAQIGVATGMAWTPVGGEILFIESALMPGKGALTVTGQLGDVMRESVKIALDFLRAHGAELGVDTKEAEEHEIHVHVPAGAIPKDGPSAGVAMTTALASLLSKRPARHDISMTGEVTLTGRVLPIGGVKEKVLAARQAGISEIILPERNRSDLRDIPEATRSELTFHFVSDVRDALDIVLLPANKADWDGVTVVDGPLHITTPTEQDTAVTDPAMAVA